MTIIYLLNTQEVRDKLKSNEWTGYNFNLSKHNDPLLWFSDEQVDQKKISGQSYGNFVFSLKDSIMHINEFIEKYCKLSLKKQLKELKIKIYNLGYGNHKDLHNLVQNLNLEELD